MSSQFVSTWYVYDGSTVQLPVTESATVSVNWGDSSGTVTGYSGTTDISHVYNDGAAAIKVISISGGGNTLTWDISGFSLAQNNLRDISECGGVLKLGNSGGQFRGCTNLTWSAVDAPVTTAVTNFNACFYNCASLNVVPAKWDTSAGTNFTDMFYGTKVFTGRAPAVSKISDRSWYLPDASFINQLIPNNDVSAREHYTTRAIDLSSFIVITAGGNQMPEDVPASVASEGATSSIATISVAESLIRKA